MRGDRGGYGVGGGMTRPLGRGRGRGRRCVGGVTVVAGRVAGVAGGQAALTRVVVRRGLQKLIKF